MLEPIEYISNEFGPRITGTDADLQTIDYIANRFRSYTSNVEFESFPVVGRSLQHLTLFLVWGYFVSVISYFFLPPLAPVLAIIMLLVYYLARFKDRNLVNLLVKKAETKNVIATFEPVNKKSKIVIFSGHHDSAFHMPLFERKASTIALIQNSAILGIVMLVISGIWKTIVFFEPSWGVKWISSYSLGIITIDWYLLPDLIFILAIIGLVPAFYFLANMVTNTPVYGANDNLTSVSMLFALGEYFQKNPPQNIEVRLISFGAEEPGLIGSAFYVKKRKQELENAININFETLGRGKLGILAKEKDNNVVHDSELVEYIQGIAEKNDIQLPSKKINFGNTDAGSFSKRNLKGTTIFCFSKDDVFDLWHSTEDVVENLDEELLTKAYRLTVKIIEDLEEGNGSAG